MKSKILFLVALLFGLFNRVGAQTLMPLPPYASTYYYSSEYIRGYWFTAPSSFVITGLRVPTDVGSGAQYIQVFKINDNPPVTYATTSTNFTTLAYINSATNGVIQPVNIVVNAGDRIGIVGYVDGKNSYSNANSFSSEIDGIPVTLNRVGSQNFNASIGIGSYFTEVSNLPLSRIEMNYIAKGIGNSIAGNSFCAGSSLAVSYVNSDTPNANNIYTVQLSDATGSFASPTVIGSLASAANSGTISATIPSGTPSGSGYRIRVNGSNPVIIGVPNNTNISIIPTPIVVTHNPTAQCAPGTVNLTLPAVTAGSTAGLNYSYWLNAAATQTLSNATTVTNTGSKLYYIVGTNQCGSDTTNVMVTFYNKPNVVAYNPPAACTGSSVNIKTAATTYGSTTNLTYTYWNSANQNITPTANAITVGGSYSIVGANSAGCKDTATVTVTFNNCGGIMSGNNGNQSNNEMEQNGLGKLQQILVKLYPNPASNVLYFECEAYQSGTVSAFITDAMGRIVRQQQFQSNSAGVQKFDVDVQSLPAGMYYFHFQLPESKENKTIKFVINK